jgi:hypothetical protein
MGSEEGCSDDTYQVTPDKAIIIDHEAMSGKDATMGPQ